jgi:hypothetical protein
MQTRQHFTALVASPLVERGRRESLPFATTERSSGRVIGTTQLMNIAFNHRRVEVGSTSIMPTFDGYADQRARITR